VQQLVLHGEFTDAPQGGVELALQGIALALFETGVEAGERLLLPALEAVDLDAELSGERVDGLTAKQAQGYLTLTREAPALAESERTDGSDMTLGQGILL
jgi:hypothetical protein